MDSKTVVLTEQNFETKVLRKDGTPVLVDYWATWCAPCRMMEPVLESLATELGDSAMIGKVNVDEQPGLAQSARVTAIPTLVLFQNGEVQDVFTGVQSLSKLKKRLKKLAA